MPNRVWFVVFLIGWMAMTGMETRAGRVTLEQTATLSGREEADKWIIAGTVTVKNRGDESAHNLQVTAASSGERLSFPMTPTLPPGGTISFDLRFPPRKLSPGRYPVVIMADYMDANEYPFSAPLVANVFLGDARFPMIFGTFPPLQVTLRGTLKFEVKNLDGTGKSLSLTAVLPREMTVARPLPDRVELSPHARKIIRIPIRNNNALPGSRYPAYVIAEYDHDGRHHSSAAGGSLVVRETNWLRDYQLPVVAAALVLVGIGVAMSLSRRARPRPRPPAVPDAG